MASSKYLLGELLVRNTENNESAKYGIESVRGLLNTKGITNTKADMEGRDLTKFLVVRPGGFVFNHRVHDKLGLGYNTSDETYIFTNDYVAFYVKPEIKDNVLLPDYLYMWFLRSEFDRYMLFKTYGSATLFFNWDNMCELEISLPDITVQKKYVDIYKAMIANQQSYERGLEDLRTTITAYVENAAKKYAECEGRRFLLGDLIKQRREKYDGSEVPIRGVSKDGFIEPKQPDADLHMYNQYYYGDFVFNPARMELNSIALNTIFEKACCSSLYEVFYVNRRDILMSEYLNLMLKKSEFARWCEYVGWGSAREYCRVDSISQYPVVIPPMDEQKAIVDLSKAYMLRKEINEQLKKQIKDICPILIKGSLKEGKDQ